MTIKCPKCYNENPETSQFCSACGTKLDTLREFSLFQTETLETSLKELSTGSTFAGRYQIIEELGKGGMGKVYKVFDREVQAKMALKLIRPDVSADKNTIERFRNELKIARDISHKNICRMYDLGREGGNYFITMEYVSGEDLKSFIRRSRQLVVGTAILIAKQVCEGLAEAHRAGVVHRDLKPGNIMIDKEGNAKIMDFGIARSVSAKGITGTGVMIGTPEYMSPEQVKGEEVDQRSDIYSLGIILYEMLTGQVPFEGDTPFTIGMKQKNDIPKDPKSLNALIPQDLSRIILKCLEKDKERRYQDAKGLMAILDNIEKGIPNAELPVPKRKTATSKITFMVSRKKFFVPLSLLAAFSIIAIGLWRFLPKHRTTSPPASGNPSIAVLPFTDLSAQEDQGYFCDGMTVEIISKLSRLEGWKVTPRTSVMSYKKSEKNLKLIGQELEVDNILEGSIRKDRDDLRISVRLIKVADLSSLWGDSYDRELISIFEVQTDIAEKIAEVLLAKISDKEKEQFAKRPTENLEAYNSYLKGLDYYYRYAKEDNENAILMFKKALELDPDYALAHAGLGNAYSQNALKFGFPMDWLDFGIEASNKAISLDPNLPEGYKALGLAYETKGWYGKARIAYEKAIELNHNFVDALSNLGMVYYLTGEPVKALAVLKKAYLIGDRETQGLLYSRIGTSYLYLDDPEEAARWFYKCLEFEPGLTWQNSGAHFGLVAISLLKGAYQKARNQAQKILSEYPNRLLGMQLAGMIELWAGDYPKAKEYYQKALQVSSHENMHAISIGYVFIKTGDEEEGLRLLNEREQDIEKQIQQGNEHPSLRVSMAAIRALQGRKPEAYRYLEQATDMGWLWYAWSLKDPQLEYLQSDSRFHDIMKKVKAKVDEMRKSVRDELMGE